MEKEAPSMSLSEKVDMIFARWGQLGRLGSSWRSVLVVLALRALAGLPLPETPERPPPFLVVVRSRGDGNT